MTPPRSRSHHYYLRCFLFVLLPGWFLFIVINNVYIFHQIHDHHDSHLMMSSSPSSLLSSSLSWFVHHEPQRHENIWRMKQHLQQLKNDEILLGMKTATIMNESPNESHIVLSTPSSTNDTNNNNNVQQQPKQQQIPPPSHENISTVLLPLPVNEAQKGESKEENGIMSMLKSAVQRVIVQLRNGKKHTNPIIQLLHDAKINMTDLSSDTMEQLHHVYHDMKQLYFPHHDIMNEVEEEFYDSNHEPPIAILGYETCEAYRAIVPNQADRVVAVAGMFNTGTNAMQFHLEHNLQNIKSVWQVPWGKHRVAAVRWNHTAPGLDHVLKANVLPIIIVRDPFHWMQSMCKSPYAAIWEHSRKRCPNLVPTKDDRKKHKAGRAKDEELHDTFPVKVIFDPDQIIYWDSLIHLYNDWYLQYYRTLLSKDAVHHDHNDLRDDHDYPRLIVRFEDMLLYAPYVIEKIASCVGTTVRSDFRYQTGQAKSHGSHTTFLQAIIKSANRTIRTRGLTNADIQFAKQHIDHPFFMDQLHYTLPNIEQQTLSKSLLI